MTTLNETINAEIAKLETEKAAIDVKINEAKSHLVTFGPWLQHEFAAAETAVKAFFDKFRPTATESPKS